MDIFIKWCSKYVNSFFFSYWKEDPWILHGFTGYNTLNLQHIIVIENERERKVFDILAWKWSLQLSIPRGEGQKEITKGEVCKGCAHVKASCSAYIQLYVIEAVVYWSRLLEKPLWCLQWCIFPQFFVITTLRLWLMVSRWSLHLQA